MLRDKIDIDQMDLPRLDEGEHVARPLTFYGSGNPQVIDYLAQDGNGDRWLHRNYLPGLFGYNDIDDPDVDKWYRVEEINSWISSVRQAPYMKLPNLKFRDPDCRRDIFHFDATFSANAAYFADTLDHLILERVALMMPIYRYPWNKEACFSGRDWADVISFILDLENLDLGRMFKRDALNAPALELNF